MDPQTRQRIDLVPIDAAQRLRDLFDALLAFGHPTICTIWERDCAGAESMLRDWCATSGVELIDCCGHVSAFRNGKTIVTVQRLKADHSDARFEVDQTMWRPAP